MTEIHNSLGGFQGEHSQSCIDLSAEQTQSIQKYQLFQALRTTKKQSSGSQCNDVPYRVLNQTLHANPQQDHESYVSTFNLLEMKVKHPLPSSKKLKVEDASCNAIGIVSDNSMSQFQSPSLTITQTAGDLSSASPFLESTALLSPALTFPCKTFTPFSQHQFWVCSDALAEREAVTQKLEDDHNSFSILSAIREHKRVDYIEHHRKQNCLALHLVDSQSIPLPSPIKKFNQIEGFPDLSYSISQLNSVLNTLPARQKYPSSTRQFQLSAIQSVTSKQKPCISLAYHRNFEGVFELSQLLINEKFLVYTKWELEAFMMSALNASVIEMFTDKNYAQILISTFNSISSALSAHPGPFTFSTEITTKDQNIREVEATVQSTYDPENGSLFVVYTIDKVLSERKPKNNQLSSSKSLKQLENNNKISKNLPQNSISSQTQMLKRKTPNSFCSEESIKNSNDLEEQEDQSSSSMKDKSFAKRIVSI